MIKKLFKTEEDFINFLWGHTWKLDMDITIEKRNELAPYLGVEFKSKYDLTKLQKDDGKWAGKEHYTWSQKGKLPIKFPVIMLLAVGRVKYTNLYTVGYVYQNDFK